MEFKIAHESKVPIYVQIEEQIQAMIAAGQLQPGDQLPTIRDLAARLRVNYNTVARVYLELDRDGIITTQRGRGTFVAGIPDEEQMRDMREEKLQTIVHAALDEARTLGYAPSEISRVFQEELAQWRAENGHGSDPPTSEEA
jgi:GntR family transcriptional regulator